MSTVVTHPESPIPVKTDKFGYASLSQLLDCAQRQMWPEMRWLLNNYQYNRHAIAIWYRSLMSGAPADIAIKIMDYKESSDETL